MYRSPSRVKPNGFGLDNGYVGLFLVGGSSHPGGGIPLVGLAAAIVAGLVGAA